MNKIKFIAFSVFILSVKFTFSQYLMYPDYDARLTDDLRKLGESPRQIIPEIYPPKGWGHYPVLDKVGTSGAHIIKLNGKYCLVAGDLQQAMQAMPRFSGEPMENFTAPYLEVIRIALCTSNWESLKLILTKILISSSKTLKLGIKP